VWEQSALDFKSEKITLINFIILLTTFFFSTSARATDEDLLALFDQKVVVHSEWLYKVLPHLDMCFLNNANWMHPSEEKSLEQNEIILNMLINKSSFEGHTKIEFGYLPTEMVFYFSITSKAIELDEGDYRVTFVFDDGEKQNFRGYVSKQFMSSDSSFGEIFKNLIIIEHKKILREAVAKMKKFKTLNIQVGDVSLPSVSLSGFTAAYKDFRLCMGEAVNYELSDPF
jgi:hypothetical protein